jgi:hypothetical protein
MVGITHDWDEENYIKSLKDAYDKYRRACYGVCDLPPEQVRETKQAFLSGVHWLATRDSYDPVELQDALRRILGEHNPFINQSS